MKSIICSFLLLTTFCLVPFVAFSSTFTSTNTIVLPTTTNQGILLPEVLDTDGQPLKVGEEYTILSTLPGGGGVYLANTGGTKCPHDVMLHAVTAEDKGEPMPVKFFSYKQHAGVVRETEDINIMFSHPTSRPCVNETLWQADYIPVLPVPLLKGNVVTGGILKYPILFNWFSIEKFETAGAADSYKLRFCPSQSICPDCKYCFDVGVIDDGSGHYPLFFSEKPYPFQFEKFKKKDA